MFSIGTKLDMYGKVSVELRLGKPEKNMFYYVYMLKRLKDSKRYYIGMTTKLHTRVKKHNSGDCTYTATYKPWQVETTVAFRSKDKAVAFEKYLKSHAGRAFAKKHF